jgi:phage baseplate assembly protein W
MYTCTVDLCTAPESCATEQRKQDVLAAVLEFDPRVRLRRWGNDRRDVLDGSGKQAWNQPVKLV